MLPQFGYIVAQAGADSRHPPSQPLYNTHSRSPTTPSSAQLHQQQQQQTKNQPTHNNPTTLSKETKPYYNAPPQPPPRSPPHGPISLHQKTTGPVLHNHHSHQPQQPATSSLPYMYSSQPNTASSQVGPNDYHTPYYPNHSNQVSTTTETQPTATDSSFRSIQQATKYPWQQQPHDPYMDYSYREHPTMVWHNGPPTYMPPSTPVDNKVYSRSTHQYDITPPLPPNSAHDNNSAIKTTAPTTTTYDSSYYVKQQSPSFYPPTTSTFRWHQDDTPDLTEKKMFRRLREYNDLMAWMDNEFWEQNDDVYQEKLQSLRKELKSIQEGDHAAFQEMVADLELVRDQTIESALCFENYQMAMTKYGLDLDVMLIEDEYKSDSQHLTELIMLVIEEHRKQIKDDREDSDQLDTDGIFQEAYARIQQKQNIRKRTVPVLGADRSSSPRQETSSRGRRLKNANATPHNINAPLSSKEEDDIENEYLAMKGVLPKRNGTTSRRL